MVFQITVLAYLVLVDLREVGQCDTNYSITVLSLFTSLYSEPYIKKSSTRSRSKAQAHPARRHRLEQPQQNRTVG